MTLSLYTLHVLIMGRGLVARTSRRRTTTTTRS